MASPLQLASASWQSRLKGTHQQTRLGREQPLEAPQLARQPRQQLLHIAALDGGELFIGEYPRLAQTLHVVDTGPIGIVSAEQYLRHRNDGRERRHRRLVRGLRGVV